jgi:hypothetical protein
MAVLISKNMNTSEKHNQISKKLIERMAISQDKSSRQNFALDPFQLTLCKARLVYIGQTIKLFNQNKPESDRD